MIGAALRSGFYAQSARIAQWFYPLDPYLKQAASARNISLREQRAPSTAQGLACLHQFALFWVKLHLFKPINKPFKPFPSIAALPSN